MSDVSLDDISSLAKRRGFIFQGSDIYGGLAGTWDYGPLGVALKRNIQNLWWKTFVEDRDDMYGIDAAILMNQKVWQASGHVDTFNDPLIEDVKTKRRFRLDHLLEENGVNIEGMNFDQMVAAISEKGLKSPDGNELGAPAQFNLMFKTHVGPVKDESSVSYLRPETAQGIFVNFKNVVDTIYPDMPFGLAQIGKAFRNEIAPREFIFRVRELEQMEIEYFIKAEEWEAQFEKWRTAVRDFYKAVGLNTDKVHEHEIGDNDRAHYSKRTIDFEYDFPQGVKELSGLAYRTDYDLSKHEEHSRVKMRYTPKEGGQPYIPHVIEPSMGVERLLFAVLDSAYRKDEINGEERIYLALNDDIAPIKYVVSPLVRNKPELVAKAREVYSVMKKKYGAVLWDDNSNVGKRYRRADEIGVPKCITIDFQTMEDNTVTVRDRDTTEQTRKLSTEL